MVAHKDDWDDDNDMMAMSASYVGDSIDWSVATVVNNRAYGINVNVIAGITIIRLPSDTWCHAL